MPAGFASAASEKSRAAARLARRHRASFAAWAKQAPQNRSDLVRSSLLERPESQAAHQVALDGKAENDRWNGGNEAQRRLGAVELARHARRQARHIDRDGAP